MPEGQSIAEMVELAPMPALLRDSLTAVLEGEIIPPERWPVIRPRAGQQLQLMAVPRGGDKQILRTVLQVEVLAAGRRGLRLWRPIRGVRHHPRGGPGAERDAAAGAAGVSFVAVTVVSGAAWISADSAISSMPAGQPSALGAVVTLEAAIEELRPAGLPREPARLLGMMAKVAASPKAPIVGAMAMVGDGSSHLTSFRFGLAVVYPFKAPVVTPGGEPAVDRPPWRQVVGIRHPGSPRA